MSTKAHSANAGLPVSTTHSLIGSIVGAAIGAAGIGGVRWALAARARLVRNGPGQMLASLRGRVYVEVEGTLRPVAQAHIEVVGGPSAGLSTTTAGDGSYEFAGLMPGDVVIRATKMGYTVALTAAAHIPLPGRG